MAPEKPILSSKAYSARFGDLLQKFGRQAEIYDPTDAEEARAAEFRSKFGSHISIVNPGDLKDARAFDLIGKKKSFKKQYDQADIQKQAEIIQRRISEILEQLAV